MDLRELRVIVAVADHGGVSRAASVLHLSASAVSHTVTSLEAELGTKLFHRLPRGMALTASGEALIGPARRALREAEAATAAVAAVDGLLAGHLHVVALRMFTVPLASVIGTFAQVHPHVVVTVHQSEGDVVVAQLVRSGECEVGVMRLTEVPDGLEVTPIAAEHIVVVMAQDHALADRTSITLAELDGCRVVAPRSGSALRIAFDGLFAGAGVVPEVVVEADNHEMMMELARAGAGLAVSSAASATVVSDRGGVAVPLDPPLTRSLGLVVRSGGLTPAAAAFRELAITVLRP